MVHAQPLHLQDDARGHVGGVWIPGRCVTVYSNDMDSIKWKLEHLADGTKRWSIISSQQLAEIGKGMGKAGEVKVEMEPVAARTLPQLPIEVWENVINHLWDDQWTLRQCVSVCRAWDPPSRFHLRRRIEIKSVQTVKAYAKMLKRRPKLSKRPYDMIVFSYRETDLSALSTAAIMLARKLPRLEELTIRELEWKPSTMHKDIFLHLSAFSSVTRLLLLEVTFPSITVFGRLVCALPGLVELICDSLRFTHDHFHRDTFGPYHNRVNIKSLLLVGNYLNRPARLIDFLAHPCISSRLQRLIIDVSIHVAESQRRCQRLLHAVSSSLLELQLDLQSSGLKTHAMLFAAGLSFTHNTSLQRLWLTFPDGLGASGLDALCQVLLSINSGQLREIVILSPWWHLLARTTVIKQVVKNMLRIHESASQEEVDNYLSSASFRTLSKVEFALILSGPVLKDRIAAEEQWNQQIVPLFPRLTKKGVFRATVRKPGYEDHF